MATASVSVVIPCYNHAHYLSEAVRSVVAQIYQDWEALVVDDGSTDGTSKVAAQFADPRVKYIRQENCGLSAARNTGIRAAEGQFLAFLDADDAWDPLFLEVCVSAMQSDQSLGFVYTRNLFIDPQGIRQQQIGGEVCTTDGFRKRLLQEGFFPVHAVLVRKQAVDYVGGFDPTLTSAEDWDLWLRLSNHYPGRGIKEPLALYRIYPGSMSTNVARMHANRVAVLTKWFGAPEGDATKWSDAKRLAYAYAYRATTIGYLVQKQPDVGWDWLAKASELWPPILGLLDTLYELALGDQPRGSRGQASLLDIEASGRELLSRLRNLFSGANTEMIAVQSSAFGNAYLALAMLSDQAGDWTKARAYLNRAVQAHPILLRDHLVLRRFAKLAAGQRIARWIRSHRPRGVG